MWQTKYAAAIPKNLGVGVDFRPCSEGYFLSGRPQSVMGCIVVMYKHLLFSPLFHIINRRHYFRDRGLKLNIANIYDGDTIYYKLPFTNQIHISNHLFGHLICTLISENQGLEKSRSVSNLRKISGPAHLNFFSVHLSFFQFVTWIFSGLHLKKARFIL